MSWGMASLRAHTLTLQLGPRGRIVLVFLYVTSGHAGGHVGVLPPPQAAQPPGSPENLQILHRAAGTMPASRAGPAPSAQRPAFSHRNQPLRADRKPGSWVSNLMSFYNWAKTQVQRVWV